MSFSWAEDLLRPSFGPFSKLVCSVPGLLAFLVGSAPALICFCLSLSFAVASEYDGGSVNFGIAEG